MKYLLLIGTILSLVMFNGCANYVTDKIDKNVAIQEFELSVTFRGTPAANSAYNYYLIISSQNIQQAIKPTNIDPYFIAPRQSDYSESRMRSAYNLAADEDLQKLYDDYFSTWSSYISYDSTDTFKYYNDPTSATLPYISSANHEIYPYNVLGFGNLSDDTNTIKLKILLPYNTFYINFLSVDENKLVQDNFRYLSSKEITYSDGFTETTTEQTNNDIDSGLDIISYTVRTYKY